MTIQRDEIFTDLLSLTGRDALEALHDMSENNTPLRLGKFILAELVSVGMNNKSGDVVFSAVLETKQSVLFSFSPISEPVIIPKVLVIGTNRTE